MSKRRAFCCHLPRIVTILEYASATLTCRWGVRATRQDRRFRLYCLDYLPSEKFVRYHLRTKVKYCNFTRIIRVS